MTSYYNKMFVSRSERVVSNYGKWLVAQVNLLSMSENPSITDVHYGNVTNSKIEVPRQYSTMASHFASFTCGQYNFAFDVMKNAEKYSGVKGIHEDETPCGYSSSGILVMDKAGIVSGISDTGQRSVIGKFEDIIGLGDEKIPREYIEVGIYGKQIPLGMILGRYLGLGTLIATLGVPTRRTAKGANLKLEPWEFPIKFADETLIVDGRIPHHSMLLAGFNRFSAHLRDHSIYAFDKQEAYGAVFQTDDISPRHTKELDLIRTMWVDPITRDILHEMKLPTDMIDLFIVASKLLEHDAHPDAMDVSYMRDRGYERFSGMVYTQMIQSLREFGDRPLNANQSVSMHPERVWYSIIGDQSTMPVDESNPIQSMKDQEVVIFGGAGGRSSQTMVGDTRRYHPNGIGVVSEATVDNGDVAAITYLTANPNYTTVRGTTRRAVNVGKEPARIVSPSMLLCPGAEKDDVKRINFLNIQNSQSTFAKGYTMMPCRTGYEKVVPYRVGDLYAVMAKQDGVVDTVTKKSIKVVYKDGTSEVVEIGRRFGKWSGKIIPHEVVTPLKEGDKIVAGDTISYNTNYFQPDPLNPKQIAMVFHVLARTLFLEVKETLDDSSAITAKFAQQLITEGTHIRYISLDYDTEIRNLLPVGTDVLSDNILCTLHPPMSGSSAIFDDAAISTLQRVSSNSPVAKYHGKIEKYEVLYTGEIEEMSSTLMQLAEQSNADLIKIRRQMKKAPVDGQIPVGFRVDGKPIGPAAAVIKVYITGETPMGDGDKAALGGQMKSIIGKVYEEPPLTEDGKEVDFVFGQLSVDNRAVTSVALMGTTNTLALAAGERFINAYRN